MTTTRKCSAGKTSNKGLIVLKTDMTTLRNLPKTSIKPIIESRRSNAYPEITKDFTTWTEESCYVVLPVTFAEIQHHVFVVTG